MSVIGDRMRRGELYLADDAELIADMVARRRSSRP